MSTQVKYDGPHQMPANMLGLPLHRIQAAEKLLSSEDIVRLRCIFAHMFHPPLPFNQVAGEFEYLQDQQSFEMFMAGAVALDSWDEISSTFLEDDAVASFKPKARVLVPERNLRHIQQCEQRLESISNQDQKAAFGCTEVLDLQHAIYSSSPVAAANMRQNQEGQQRLGTFMGGQSDGVEQAETQDLGSGAAPDEAQQMHAAQDQQPAYATSGYVMRVDKPGYDRVGSSFCLPDYPAALAQATEKSAVGLPVLQPQQKQPEPAAAATQAKFQQTARELGEFFDQQFAEAYSDAQKAMWALQNNPEGSQKLIAAARLSISRINLRFIEKFSLPNTIMTAPAEQST